MNRIIDGHVHCYPANVIADPAGWGTERGERHWVDLVTKGPQGWADPEGLLRTMDAEGVERVVLQGWYWQNPATVLEQNRWHAEWVERFPDRFWAVASFHPDLPDPVAELERARKWGARGIGEILPQVQSTEAWGHPCWEAILSWTRSAGWPVCVHITEPVGHDYPGRFPTSLEETVNVLEKWPAQHWVLAHWGGGIPFFALNRRVAQALQNVWFDTAASPLLYHPKVWRIVNELVGSDRILFGSDFPLRLYPRRDRLPGWTSLLAEVRQHIPDQTDLEKILSGNAITLFAGDR